MESEGYKSAVRSAAALRAPVARPWPSSGDPGARERNAGGGRPADAAADAAAATAEVTPPEVCAPDDFEPDVAEGSSVADLEPDVAEGRCRMTSPEYEAKLLRRVFDAGEKERRADRRRVDMSARRLARERPEAGAASLAGEPPAGDDDDDPLPEEDNIAVARGEAPRETPSPEPEMSCAVVATLLNSGDFARDVLESVGARGLRPVVPAKESAGVGCVVAPLLSGQHIVVERVGFDATAADVLRRLNDKRPLPAGSAYNLAFDATLLVEGDVLPNTRCFEGPRRIVKHAFTSGAEYGEDYLELQVGDPVTYLGEEQGWLRGFSWRLKREGWYPPGYTKDEVQAHV